MGFGVLHRAFKADQKVLHQKKDVRISVLQGLEIEVATAREKSQESPQRDINIVYKVRDQMMEHTENFVPNFLLLLIS